MVDRKLGEESASGEGCTRDCQELLGNLVLCQRRWSPPTDSSTPLRMTVGGARMKTSGLLDGQRPDLSSARGASAVNLA